MIFRSWGKFPYVDQEAVILQKDAVDSQIFSEKTSYLPFGNGRSYGDSCLNEEGMILVTKNLDRFIDFDSNTGILKASAGVLLGDIIESFLPRGWFLPVSPGTKFVTLGGAVANDIHGKNHHGAGSFGNHVLAFTLLRSNGEIIECKSGSALFNATIGGLGLTGLMLDVTIRLKPVNSSFLDMQLFKFSSLDEFFDLSKSSDKDFEYTVAWIDSLASGKKLARGVFMRANHSNDGDLRLINKPKITVPDILPCSLINFFTVKAFNEVFYYGHNLKNQNTKIDYDKYFYPLDGVNNWNNVYGKNGFIQYQFVVPFDSAKVVIKEVLEYLQKHQYGSFLSVLKVFGDIKSPGMLSFPRSGVTLAMDFPYIEEKTERIISHLDKLILDAGGALYPAKDALMSLDTFEKSYPQYKEFTQYIDPNFSSSFWRRVTSS